MAVRVSSAAAPLTRDRVELLGTHVDRVPFEELSDWLERFLQSAEPHQIVTANLDFVAIARRRPDFARVIAEADLVVCDGKPLQWAANIQGSPIPARVTGMDLILRTAKLSAAQGYRIFLLGAAPGVAERAAAALVRMFPDAQVVGAYAPPAGEFSEAENAHMVALVRAARADALFVALGAPKQDLWIAAHLDELGVPLCVGIGGVFNFLSGETRRAPEWMQRAGFEWAFRLMQEPSRLWRRYLVNDLPIFFRLLARQMVVRGRAKFGHVRRVRRVRRVRDEDATLLPVASAAIGQDGATRGAMGEPKAAPWAASRAKNSVRARRSVLRSRHDTSAPAPAPAGEGERLDDETRVRVQGSAWNPF